jgi:hypothetical protein
MPTRLTLSNPALFPIQAFFNAVSDDSFVHVVDCLTSGIGFHIDETDCMFPSDLDPGEEPFDGVQFSIFEDNVVISLAQLREYLDTICRHHIASHPEDMAIITQLLARSAHTT